MESMSDKYLTVKEVEDILHITRTRVGQLVKSGIFRAIKVERDSRTKWIIAEDSVREYQSVRYERKRKSAEKVEQRLAKLKSDMKELELFSASN